MSEQPCYIRTHDGALLNAAAVIEFRIFKDERPEATPLSVVSNGYERAILGGILPANGLAGTSAIAVGWRHQLEALLGWLAERLGRARLIDVGEFLRSDSWEKAPPVPQPTRPDPGHLDHGGGGW